MSDKKDRKRDNYISAWLSDEENEKFEAFKRALRADSNADTLRRLLELFTEGDIVNKQMQELQAYTQ